MAKAPEDGPAAADAIADEAAKHTLALNPMVGLRGRDFVDAAQTVVKAAIGQPQIAIKQWFSFMGDLGKIVAGESARAAQPGDKRFNDPAWKSSASAPGAASELPGLGRCDPCLCRQGRPRRSGARAREALSDILVDALSPTNGLVSNPPL